MAILSFLVVLAVTATGDAVAITTWHLKANSNAPDFGSIPESNTCISNCDPTGGGGPFPPEEEYQTGTMASNHATGTVLAYVQDAYCYFDCADVASTYRWNGKTWSLLATENRPDVGTVAEATMAEDGIGIVRVEPCGSIQCIYRWNGSWQLLHPATSPPASHYANVAYDVSHGKLVLFRSFMLPGEYKKCSGDTWTWDGSNWTRRLVSVQPGCSYYQAMARDPAGGLMLFEGGKSYSGGGTAKTWRWNGAAWTLLTTPVQPPKLYPGKFSVAYNPATKEDVIALGTETWTWNGTTWRKRPLGIGPNPGPSASDPKRGAVVTISGGDTWLWQKDVIL
jgi:hypothetical protein